MFETFGSNGKGLL